MQTFLLVKDLSKTIEESINHVCSEQVFKFRLEPTWYAIYLSAKGSSRFKSKWFLRDSFSNYDRCLVIHVSVIKK